MARTFNRYPFTISSPSKNDIQDYFFTHSNFKGLSNNNNFLLADQETFSSCDNVYVDAEGLLRSRPCLHRKAIVVTLPNGDTILENVLDAWVYGDVYVYHTEERLTFDNHILSICSQIAVGTKVKLVPAENKIFIFEENSLRYYDMDNGTISTAQECEERYVHIPVTKLVTNNTITDLEPENELTTAHGTKYLFDNALGVNFNTFVGKEVSIRLDDVDYHFKFVQNNEQVFVKKLSNLVFNQEHISISDVGSMVIAEQLTEASYTVYYSVNGKTFTPVDTLENAVSIPVISSDGHYICYPAERNIYVYKVVDDGDSNVPLETWVTLLDAIDKSSYDSWIASNLRFDSRSNIKMLSYDNFSAVCKFGELLACIVCHAGDCHSYKIQTTDYLAGLVNDSNEDIVATGSVSDIAEDEWKLAISDNRQFKDASGSNSHWLTIAVKVRKFYGEYQVHITNSYSSTSGMKSNNKTIPVQPGETKFIVDGIDVVVNIDKTQNNATVSITIPKSLSHLYDAAYPFGNRYESVTNKPANVDMYTSTNDFFVIINCGVICVIDKYCTNRVRYLSNAWSYSPQFYDFSPCDYGVSISPTHANFTAPEGKQLHYYLYSHKYVSASVGEQYTSELVQALDHSSKSVTSPKGHVLTQHNLYIDSVEIPLLFEADPIKVSSSIYLFKNGLLYSSVLDDIIEITEITPGIINYIMPDYVAEIDSFYFAKDKKLYISAYPSDGDFAWYFPKIATETFDYRINNIHPISATEMGVFLKDSVYYIQRSDKGYLYYKSKIQVGCRQEADVITSFDGKYILFASERGLVALSYQDFVASTEQTLSYLSDNISTVFKDYYSNGAIKLFKHEFWILCYKKEQKTYLLLDIRNNSWWPMTLPYPVSKFIVFDDGVKALCNGKLYSIRKGEDAYYDYDEVKSDIDWHITSQKLHLNAPNYYKHISNITLASVLDTDKEIYLDLTLHNYRKKIHKSEVESFKFKVDSIRTYIKRLNYSKVNEFQYLLTSSMSEAADEEELVEVPKAPLSLSSITVKYKITGQVR